MDIKTVKSILLSALLLMLPAVITSCSGDEFTTPIIPDFTITPGASTETSVSFSVVGTEVSFIEYSLSEDGNPDGVSTEVEKATGIDPINEKSFTIDGLTDSKTYTLKVAAVSSTGDTNQRTAKLKTSPFGGVLFTNGNGSKYSKTNYGVTLTTDDGKQLALDMYCEGYKFLPEGTYTIGGQEGKYIDKSNPRYTYYKADGKTVGLKSGNIDIKVNMVTQSYTFEGTIVLADNKELRLRYQGALEGIAVFDELHFNPAACKRVDVRDPAPGEYYLKLNDSDWTFEMVLQLFAATDSKELPAGTYIFGNDQTAGTIGTKTCIDAYRNFSGNGGYMKAGKAVVTKDGNKYKIEMDLTAEDNQRYVGTFEGEITNMDLTK